METTNIEEENWSNHRIASPLVKFIKRTTFLHKKEEQGNQKSPRLWSNKESTFLENEN